MASVLDLITRSVSVFSFQKTNFCSYSNNDMSSVISLASYPQQELS